MDKSSISYTIFLFSTVLVYRVSGYIFSITDFYPYTIFFGAGIQVFIICILTILYNYKMEYSGIVTFLISIFVLIYGGIELRIGAIFLPNSYVVGLMHWSSGLLIGIIALTILSNGQNYVQSYLS